MARRGFPTLPMNQRRIPESRVVARGTACVRESQNSPRPPLLPSPTAWPLHIFREEDARLRHPMSQGEADMARHLRLCAPPPQNERLLASLHKQRSDARAEDHLFQWVYQRDPCGFKVGLAATDGSRTKRTSGWIRRRTALGKRVTRKW